MFTIETNQKPTLWNCLIGPDLAAAVTAFGLTNPNAAKRVKKLNRTSEIFVITDASDNRWVLRASALDTASKLSLQARIFSELEDVNVVRPRPLRNGVGYVYKSERAWICYAYAAGEEYAIDHAGAMDAIREALNVLAAIQRWTEGNPNSGQELPLLAVIPDRFAQILDDLLAYDGENAPSAAALDRIVGDRPALSAILSQAKVANITPVSPTHCDLHHGNVIAGPEGPTIIDLEDICRDSVSVAAAHGIFKLARHAVYLGLMDAEASHRTLVRPAVEYGAQLGLLPKQPAAVMTLAAHRTARDVANILRLARHPKTAWFTYDLAKKTENFLEIAWYINQDETARN